MMARAIASNALTIGIVILLAVASIVAWGAANMRAMAHLKKRCAFSCRRGLR